MILGSYRSFAQTAEELFPKAIQLEEVKGELEKAIEVYQTIVTQFSTNRPIASKALLHIGLCYEKLGDAQAREARKAYERIVRDYADQTGIVAQARMKLSALGSPVSVRGLATRRVLADASGLGEKLSADGKYIRGLDRETGDVVQFEVASGQRTRIKNSGAWSETEKSLEDQVFSRDGKQIAYNAEVLSDAKDWSFPLRIRNLDGSGFRTLYSEKDSYIVPLDWSPDAGFILADRSQNKGDELILISTTDGSVRVLRSISLSWNGL